MMKTAIVATVFILLVGCKASLPPNTPSNVYNAATPPPPRHDPTDKLSSLEGKYSDAILAPRLFSKMPASLQGVKAEFAKRLETVVPIDSTNRYYSGSGCAAHECTTNEAAWTIDKTTGRGQAIMMIFVPETQGMEAHENFRLFGAPSTDTLAPPLADWATKNGMTEGNVVPDSPVYQAPPK